MNSLYLTHCNTGSDINEHLPTLKQYGETVKTITEMGVRDVVSTWAFLESKPERLISIDIVNNNNIPYAAAYAQENGLNFEFRQADTLNIEIEETELLFIDTLHTYNQLYNELVLHAGKVSKYIIMHDTVSFGHRDEHIYDHASQVVKFMGNFKEGLVPAIEDFLKTKEGQNWRVKEVFTNNNGLTVIERV